VTSTSEDGAGDTPRTLYRTVNGLRLHFAEWDAGGETTLLLLHGFLDHGRSWDFMVRALPAAAAGHVVAPDWRGHGRSAWIGPGGYYHFSDYLRDLDAIVRTVRRERLVVVAHSMGAMAAAMWAGARGAGCCDGLLLLEGLGAVPVSTGDLPQRVAKWLDQTAPFAATDHDKPVSDRGHAIARLRRRDPKLTQSQAEHLAAHGTRTDTDGQVRWRFDPLHRTQAPYPFLPEAAEAFFSRIAVPCLWVGGEESVFLGSALDERLAPIPDLRRVHLPDAGHMVHHHQPVALAAEVAAFVEAVTGST
jgi:pimeloyl-ACP methyl ester carboxylesterase